MWLNSTERPKQPRKGRNFATMEINKKNDWGGARRGAGRPLSFGVKSAALGVRVPEAEAARLRAMAEAEGLTLGAFLVRLADYWQEGHPIPDTTDIHHIPDTVEGCGKPDINPIGL